MTVERDYLLKPSYFVIFLDWDGVIITPRSLFVNQENPLAFDPIAIQFLNRICSLKDNIRIVISSVHRVHPGATDQMRAAGFTGKFFNKFEGSQNMLHKSEGHTTGPIRDNGRGAELEEWFLQYGDLVENNGEGYLILDDESDFYDYQKSHLIQTDMYSGLSFWNMSQAEDYILGEIQDYNDADWEDIYHGGKKVWSK